MKTKEQVTYRVSDEMIERTQRRFNIATGAFVASTIAFFALMVIAIIAQQPTIGDIAIGVIFVVWFPALAIAAMAAKRLGEVPSDIAFLIAKCDR